MAQIIRKLRRLLDKKQKRTMLGLALLMVVGAFLQTAGVGLLVSVVTVVIDPQAVQNSRLAGSLYALTGQGSYEKFAILVMSLLILTYVLKNVFLFVQQKLM